jgi:hypothetical protein
MEENQEALFRKLLKNQEPEKPGSDFTGSVMKMVQIQAVQEAAEEMKLVHLLNTSALTEIPSKDFNTAIMGRILVPKGVKAEAIISQKAWFMIAASLLLIIFCSFLLLAPGTAPAAPTATDLAMSGVYEKINTLPVVYPITFFTMGLLTVADYLLRQRTGRDMAGQVNQ